MDEWNIPLINLGDLKFKLIQGGMGVGISGANLASAVANEGGLGIIASVGLSEVRSYLGNYEESSAKALKEEIEITKSKMNGRGALGVNIMRPLTNYESLVETAISAGVSVIVSGAAPPLDLPAYLGERKDVKLIPIASSGRSANVILKRWINKYGYTAPAVIVEGTMAGGHLGFKIEQISDPKYSLENIVREVVDAVSPYGKIPVIAAGGVYYGGDIKRALSWGAAGVQMGTRFVTTEECEAHINFKKAYLDCKKEDLTIIESPVGKPGRAIKNNFLEEVAKGIRKPVDCPYYCLIPCKQNDSPYCIANALVEARKGQFENGFVFAGSNAWRTKEDGIISVKNLFEKLNKEYLEGKVSE